MRAFPFLMAAAILVGCGGPSVTVTDEDGNTTTISRDGDSVTFDSDDGSGTTTIDDGGAVYTATDEDGQVTEARTGDKVSGDFPIAFAPAITVPDGGIMEVDNPDVEHRQASFTVSPSDIDAVVAFYKDMMDEVESELNTPNMTMLNGKADGKDVILSIQSNDGQSAGQLIVQTPK